MSKELAEVYREAIALTEQQAVAIAQEDWQMLGALLMKRDRLITRAEALIHEGVLPGEHQEVRMLLTQLRVKDQANQAIITRKYDMLKLELQSLQQSNGALSGYMDNLRGVAESHFIDHDQ